MKRKLVKQGGSALTVSLPAKWVKKYGLEAGDEIDVVEEGSEIVINQSKEKSLGEISIDIPADVPFARRFLFLPYMRGYNTIKVHFHKNETLEKLQVYAPLMLGFEIVEQGPDYCIIKNIAKGIETEFDPMFNRQILVSISMGKDIYDALVKGDYKRLESVIGMENLANKLNIFCRRMLNLHGYKDDKKTSAMYHISCLMEGIADNYKDICVEVLNKKLKLTKECMDLMKNVTDYLGFFYRLFNKFETKDLSELKKIETKTKEILGKIEKKESKESVVVGLLRSIDHDIHHASEELLV